MKILYITTISNTVNAFLIPHIKLLIDQGNQVDVAFNIVQDVKPEIFELGCKVYNIEFQRSPTNKQNYSAYKKLKKLIQNERYDFVHTHTPMASALVRLACKDIKNVKVFYTAHGFHFYKGAPLKNWLLYYPIERWLSKFTDVLITINKEDYLIAKKSFFARQVEYIPGIGVKTQEYQKIVVDKLVKRTELGLSIEAFVLISVGELNKNKNHETVIKAIAKLKNTNISYIICGSGSLETQIKSLAKSLGVEKQIKLLGYRIDLAEIYQIADLFVFPSFREGLPVALIEAMASGLPIVCSNIRGNRDLIQDKEDGYLVNSNDINGFATCIDIVAQHNKISKHRNYYEIINQVDLKSVLKRMNEIYTNAI